MSVLWGWVAEMAGSHCSVGPVSSLCPKAQQVLTRLHRESKDCQLWQLQLIASLIQRCVTLRVVTCHLVACAKGR